MKLPNKLFKSKDVIAIGHYAIYTESLFQAMKVATRLSKKDIKTGLPFMGKIIVKGKSYYWCRYGVLNDPDVYAKKK